MTKINRPDSIPLAIASLLLPVALSAQTVVPAAPPPKPAAPKSPWATAASVALKESFDSNVYLQDLTPNPASVASAAVAGFNAVPAKKGSLVSSVLPRFGLDYKPGEVFYASAIYAPELTYYSSASSENYVAQRGTLNLGGKIKEVSWDLLNTASFIDGNELGPTFGRPGEVPAIGGIPLRDRREAFIFRNGFKLTYPIGAFFLRPVATTYFNDFQTEQHASPKTAPWVYENYIDRNEVVGGLDVGYKVAEKTHVVLGYRYGAQDQGNLLGKNSPYDNSFQRILVGVEGSPAEWLKLAVMVGPDIRDLPARPSRDSTPMKCSATSMPPSRCFRPRATRLSWRTGALNSRRLRASACTRTSIIRLPGGTS